MSYQKYDLKYEFKPNKFIFVPSRVSREKGLSIKKELEQKWIVPTFFQHLLPRGHVKAIKKHLFQDWFIKIDLENFFYNVTQTKITRTLAHLLKDYKKAREIAKISTVTSDYCGKKIFHLPYGFVQSSVIASICLDSSKLGKYLHYLNSNGYKISVYVDDIIISGKNENNYEGIIEKLLKYSLEANLPLNPQKTIFSNKSITAFNIDLTFNNTLINPIRMAEFEEILQSDCSLLRKAAIQKYIKDVEKV